LIVCIGQFYIGRKLGGRYGDKISGAQGLGQKNTVLAIWLALTYLSPITSIGPASYIIWQNSINSYQLYLKEKQTMKGS
jgi:BASS family bile acid:Na+ symporter